MNRRFSAPAKVLVGFAVIGVFCGGVILSPLFMHARDYSGPPRGPAWDAYKKARARARILVANGIEAEENKHYSQALTDYRKALALNPYSEDTGRLKLGDLDHKLGNEQEAFTVYHALVYDLVGRERFPFITHSWVARYVRSLALSHTQWDTAVRMYSQIASGPDPRTKKPFDRGKPDYAGMARAADDLVKDMPEYEVVNASRPMPSKN